MIKERTMTVAEFIATLATARKNCIVAGNTEWRDKHEQRLDWIERNALPSGSGIDAGTKLWLDDCDDSELTFRCSYHHMNDGGMYDGWTEHTVRVRATFTSMDVYVGGRNRNEIKDYLADVFSNALQRQLVETAEGFHWPQDKLEG